jgi:hypothetical protein
MTIGRVIAITAVVCAAIGMTTQAEAAKRKSTNSIKLIGCAYWAPLCGIVMQDFAGNIYALNPPVLPLTPLTVTGKRSTDPYVGFCRATRVDVTSVKNGPERTCGYTAR